MKRRGFIKSASIAAVIGSIAKPLAIHGNNSRIGHNFMKSPFDEEGQWYKAALHVHTTSSDGDVDVPTRIAQYRKKQFDVVTITDHRVTNDLSGMSDDKFLAISGIEFHPKTASGELYHHFLGLGLPHPYNYDRSLEAQQIIDDIKSKGALIFYAHPYWTGHTYEEMNEVNGYLGLEVYNASCRGSMTENSAIYWDQMLNKGHVLSAIATDDVHKSKNVGRAWTMIKAKSLHQNDILSSLSRGLFYSTTGPEITSFKVESDIVKVTCSPVDKILIRTSGSGPGKVFSAKRIKNAEWDIKIKNAKWVRCEVIDKDGKTAWANPIFLK